MKDMEVYNSKKIDDIEVLEFSNSSSFDSDEDTSLEEEIFVVDDEEIISYDLNEPINVSLESINSLNIIINDGDCREDFINSVCTELDRDGIKYTFTRNFKDINIENAIVITLDQQYMAGPATVIFAPLQNDRLGNSDALALAAKVAFQEKGFLVDGVACGQMGFRENTDGTISERIPTDTENIIDSSKDVSFVTISFGTQKTDTSLVAESIESILARYYSFITKGYENADLIYCVENGESYDDIAQKLDTSSSILYKYNDSSDESILLTGDALINPVVANIKEFNKTTQTNIYKDKAILSK